MEIPTRNTRSYTFQRPDVSKLRDASQKFTDMVDMGVRTRNGSVREVYPKKVVRRLFRQVVRQAVRQVVHPMVLRGLGMVIPKRLLKRSAWWPMMDLNQFTQTTHLLPTYHHPSQLHKTKITNHKCLTRRNKPLAPCYEF